MRHLAADLRYAWRTLRQTPVFTIVAVLSIALGIGANAAIFTLVDQVLLRLLPVKDPARLVMLRGPSGDQHYGSNFAGWQLMKSLSSADAYRHPRYVAHQVYYSLVGRDYEWELMPLGLDQGVGALVWSPLGWGRLTGRIRRDTPLPARSRLHKTADAGPPVADSLLFAVVDELDAIATESGKTIPQVALNWLLRRPTVSSVIIGARDSAQLTENLGATGWSLDAEQIARLDAVSDREPPYPHFPYFRQEGFARINPPLFPVSAYPSGANNWSASKHV